MSPPECPPAGARSACTACAGPFSRRPLRRPAGPRCSRVCRQPLEAHCGCPDPRPLDVTWLPPSAVPPCPTPSSLRSGCRTSTHSRVMSCTLVRAQGPGLGTAWEWCCVSSRFLRPRAGGFAPWLAGQSRRVRWAARSKLAVGSSPADLCPSALSRTSASSAAACRLPPHPAGSLRLPPGRQGPVPGERLRCARQALASCAQRALQHTCTGAMHQVQEGFSGTSKPCRQICCLSHEECAPGLCVLPSRSAAHPLPRWLFPFSTLSWWMSKATFGRTISQSCGR